MGDRRPHRFQFSLQAELHLGGVDAHGRLVASSDTQQAIVYVDGSGHEVDILHTTGDSPATTWGLAA
jgi:hypothetical protein